MRKIGVLLTAIGVFIVLNASPGYTFEWLTFEEGLQKAEESGMPLVVYFYNLQSTQIRSDKKVWLHPLLQRYYDRFVYAHVEIGIHGKIVNRYGVKSFPSVLFFDSKGRELVNHRIEEDRLKITILAARMNRVLTDIENFAMLESQMKRFKDNPKMVLMYAKGLRDRAQFDHAEEHFLRLFAWDGISSTLLKEAEQEYTVMLFLQAAQYFYRGEYDRCADTMYRFLEKYPDDNAEPQARYLLGMALYEGGKKSEGEKMLKELARNKKNGIFADKARLYLAEKK